MLDLAADRLEVANLLARHGADVGSVEHDDGLAGVQNGCILKHGCRHGLPVGFLDPQGDCMGAVAHALMGRWRGRQQHVENADRVSKRGARTQLGLHALQFRCTPRRQQLTDRREQASLFHRRGSAAMTNLEPWCGNLDRAEQRLQPTRPPLLERLQHLAVHTDPPVGRILRQLIAQHARLQLG